MFDCGKLLVNSHFLARVPTGKRVKDIKAPRVVAHICRSVFDNCTYQWVGRTDIVGLCCTAHHVLVRREFANCCD